MTTAIKRKSQMYELYHRGTFGNKNRNWLTLEDYLASDFHGLVALRETGKVGGKCYYNLDRNGVLAHIPEFPKGYNISEMLPSDKLLLQGEIQRDSQGLYLFYSKALAPMRDALKQSPQHARGVAVTMILQHYLDPSSLEDIYSLLDNYPDHVIEFSTYSCKVGEIPNRNTVIWEVRQY